MYYTILHNIFKFRLNTAHTIFKFRLSK